MSLVDFMQLCGKLHVPVRPEQPEDQNSELERLESRLEALDSAKEERRTAMREQYLPENDAPADERASWKRITRASAERRFKERV
jgi:hypothetical protein